MSGKVRKRTGCKLLIFDGDDTLWSTMPLYDRVKDFFAEQVRALVPSKEFAIDYLDQVDEANVQKYGFSKKRFQNSLVDSYRTLCVKNGIATKTTIVDKLKRKASSIFKTPATTNPDAKAALDRLAPHHRLVLATKGDLATQKRRIRQSGLRNYFKSVYVLRDKDEKAFRAILSKERFQARDAISIGNSMRSDVNPALCVGMEAILVFARTWRYENEEPQRSKQFHTVDSLMKAADVILKERL